MKEAETAGAEPAPSPSPRTPAGDPAVHAAALIAGAPAGATVGRASARAALRLQRDYGNAAVARLLLRKEYPDDQRAVELPAGTELYADTKQRSKPVGTTQLRQPVALISQTSADYGQGYYQGYWKVSLGGTEYYIKQEALAGSIATHLEQWRRKDTDASLGNPASGRFRALILEELKPFMGTDPDKPYKSTLERTKDFQKIVSDAELKTARDAGQTTCILFLRRILTNAAMKLNKEAGVKVPLNKYGAPTLSSGYAGLVNLAAGVSDTKRVVSQIGHRSTRMAGETGHFAWWEASAAMPKTRRPKPGDMYVLHENENRSTWSHIGFILKAPASTVDSDEMWVTVDGGQGLAREKKEAFETRSRRYVPATNLIEGEPNQAKDPKKAPYRWLLGWVDVDQLVKLPQSPAASS